MKRKAAAEYVVEVNGTPDYAKIPEACFGIGRQEVS